MDHVFNGGQALYDTGMDKQHILVVDDDPDIVKTIRDYLEQSGYSVAQAADGEQALTAVRHQRPDCVVLDVMMPKLDGWGVVQALRADAQTADIPIIILTARVDDTDKIVGLEMGADDYITKPFNPRELLARIRVQVRRTARQQPADPTLTVGDIHLDPQRRIVRLNGETVNLTATEYDILHTFMQYPGYVFTRDELLEKALGYSYAGLGRTLDSHIKNLRRKIEPNPAEPYYILAVYGVGYRMMEDEA